MVYPLTSTLACLSSVDKVVARAHDVGCHEPLHALNKSLNATRYSSPYRVRPSNPTSTTTSLSGQLPGFTSTTRQRQVNVRHRLPSQRTSTETGRIFTTSTECERRHAGPNPLAGCPPSQPSLPLNACAATSPIPRASHSRPNIWEAAAKQEHGWYQRLAAADAHAD